MQGAGLNGHALKSMKDFARQIAAREKCPSFTFGFEPLHSTVLIHQLPMPKSVIRAIRSAIHSVI
jgi:hypothetical protein